MQIRLTADQVFTAAIVLALLVLCTVFRVYYNQYKQEKEFVASIVSSQDVLYQMERISAIAAAIETDFRAYLLTSQPQFSEGYTKAKAQIIKEAAILKKLTAKRELKKHHLTNNLFHIKDGEEALEFIFATGKYKNVRDEANPPRLILLDIQMPKISGIEVLEPLKSDERTKVIPVVILTSSKEDPDKKACYKLGANSYIVKPVHFEGIAESIRNLGFYWLLLNQPPI